MKYIKTYKLFEADSIESTERDTLSQSNAKMRLNKYIKDISEYQSKKKTIDNIVLNNVDNKDITKDIDKIIGDNQILSYYLPIVYIKKQILNLENKMKYDKESQSSRQNDVSSLNNLTDQKDKQSQADRLKEQIKEITDRMQDNKVKLKMLQDQLNKEELALKKKIDLDKKDLEKSSKSI